MKKRNQEKQHSGKEQLCEGQEEDEDFDSERQFKESFARFVGVNEQGTEEMVQESLPLVLVDNSAINMDGAVR